jgi:2-polyprenyl-3-methyl-5-hydroxy-6-metoxy-1,4-benzoquinol methylase
LKHIESVKTRSDYIDYGFVDERPSPVHSIFTPAIMRMLGENSNGRRVLDVGCGNGFLCGEFHRRGWNVTGIDLSPTGIALARSTYPEVRFEQIAADMDMLKNLEANEFDVVVSTEVIEHVYAPRDYALGCFHALKPGGTLICTTPYHGYFKNLAISLAGKWDDHANPLWDCGHIKLWSERTLGILLREMGFVDVRFCGLGRVPLLSMMLVAQCRRPNAV